MGVPVRLIREMSICFCFSRCMSLGISDRSLDSVRLRVYPVLSPVLARSFCGLFMSDEALRHVCDDLYYADKREILDAL